MAEFRSIHCKTWRDDWFPELDIDAKLLWLYLITNQAASVSGIYQLPKKFIAFETGIDIARVTQLIDMFRSDGKIEYDEDTSVVWVRKMREYQSNGSPKVQKRIETDFNTIPDCRVKGIYAQKYGIDTVSIPNPELGADTDTETDTETDTKQTQTQYQTTLSRLEARFSELTGIPLPPRKTPHDKKSSATGWWNPLGVDIYKNLCAEDEIIALKVIEAAIKKMHEANLTISSPRSIVKVAASERGRLNGNHGSTGNPMLDAIAEARKDPNYGKR